MITVVVVILILVPLVAIGVFVARFDPNAYKPEITAAIDRASGRKLSLNGPLSLGLSLAPVISASDVTLANPPGFSRPEMANVSRLDAKVALLPLLSGRIEIRSLSLVRPEIAVEINREGESNLAITAASKPAGPSTPAGQAEPARGAKKPVEIGIGQFTISNGKLSWQDDRSGRHGVLLLRSLSAISEAEGTRVRISAEGDYAGLDFSLKGTSGGFARLMTPGAGSAWPIELAIASGPAMVKLSGSVADPAAGRGYHLAVEADLPAIAALAPLLPGVKLPPLHGVTLSADLADTATGRPEASNVALRVAASDLGSLRPGLKLGSLSLVAPALDQPCKLTVAGTLGATPFSLTATLGPPAALLPAGIAPPPPAAPWPLAIRASAAGADIAISGTMTGPAELAGANLALSAQIPELARLSPFVGFELPALSPMTVSGQIADAQSGWRQWVRLSALTLASPEGDLTGHATLSFAGTRPAISGALSAARLDLDRLRKVLAVASPASRGAPARGVPAMATPAAPASAHEARLIPDTPLPFGTLTAIDADLSFAVGRLIAGGAQYANIDGKLSLKDGKLVLAPFVADVPAGHVQLTASADGAGAKPAVGVTIEAPTLALAPLLASFGLPGQANGTVAVRAELKGAGTTLHAIAAGLNGRLGIAMAGGSVDRSVLRDLFGPVLQRAQVPPEMLGKGASEVRCVAVRIDATGGTGRLAAGLLEMTGLTLTGSGNFWLGPETLGLTMVPTLQYRDSRLALPVKVEGSFLSPKVTPEAAEAARSAAGVAGRLVNPQSELGRFLSALSGGNASHEPDCGPALSLARFGASGPAAPPASVIAPTGSGPAPGQQPTPKSPLDLLKGLLH